MTSPAWRASVPAWLLACLLLPTLVSAQDAATAMAACLDCHDYGEDAPAHQVLLGSHGIDGDAADMAGRRGCLDCHGSSAAHTEKPRQYAPDLSFGPRWSASGGAQDAPCLSCHQQGSASNWQHALHMVNNLTCVTCHDIHTQQDRVLIAAEQGRVCTACHKAQKTGIHDLGINGPDNPPCSACHNPHDHEAAAPRMASNQSAGCTFCHTGQQMESLAALNPRAGNYHRAIARGKRECLDCHQGISHAPEGSAPLLHPSPVRGRQLTLFYPGNATRQWLTSEHPGSQPLRQGSDCSLCHRGDEAQMGARLGADLSQPWRSMGIAFSRIGEQLQIDINWSGSDSDAYLNLMWGDDSNTEFRRGGCFAACHDTDRSPASRVFYPGHGREQEATMGAIAPGADLWRIALGSSELTTSRVGAGNAPQPASRLQAQTDFSEGQWSVRILIDNSGRNGSEFFIRNQRYTFGIALHGSDNPGREHWVSLPMTFSLDGHSSDFVAE